MPRYAAKVDTNHPAIVRDLRRVGATVQSLAAVGRNVPDLLVGYRGVNYVIEVKNDKGKLTEGQTEWHAAWRGSVVTVRNADEALKVIGAIQ